MLEVSYWCFHSSSRVKVYVGRSKSLAFKWYVKLVKRGLEAQLDRIVN